MKRRRALGNLLVDYDFKPKGRQVDIELFFQLKCKSIEKKLEKELRRHGGIKFQVSINVLLGKYKIDTEEYFEIRPWFQNCVTQILTFHSIKGKVDYAKNVVLALFDAFIQMGSGWFLKEIIMLRLGVFKCNPFGGCSSVNLPISFRRCILNILCKDNRCFVYSVLAALRKCKNPSRYSNYVSFVPTLNLKGISFPTRLNEIPKFEKNNGFTINVFGLFREKADDPLSRFVPFPMYISTNFDKSCHRKHINLLLHDSHFMLIRNLNAFITPFFWKKTRYFCTKCLVSFTSKISYELHEKADCTDKVYTGQSYILPLKGTKGRFKNISRQIKNHFVIYADFESYNEVLNKQKGRATLLKTKHNLNAVGAILLSKYSEYSRPPFIYLGVNVMERFVRYLYQYRAEISFIFDNFRQPLSLRSSDIRQLAQQKKCYLCGISFKNPDVRKVIDHAHLGREGKGRDVNYACNTCNLLYSCVKFSSFQIPIVMHNAMNYDMHFIVQDIFKFVKTSISVLPRSSEKFLTLSFDNFSFIDSFQFLPNSLSNLADLLVKNNIDDLKETQKYFPSKKLLPYVIRKGVMCYDYIDSWLKLDERELPPKEAFFNSLTNEGISEKDYKHALEMFKILSCRTIGDYLRQYLKIDILLLADVFESFREKSLDYYGLDPVKYLTAPALSYDAMLKFTNVHFDLITEIDMYNFFEKGIRGGMTNVVRRYARVEDTREHIVYYDCNNLYGYAMIQPLPMKDFAWLDQSYYSGFDVREIRDDNEIGYILEVTLNYPKHLHDLHDMFPLAPEKLSVDYSQLSPYAISVLKKYDMPYVKSSMKLISTLSQKKCYILHYRNLKLYLQLGLQVEKIHRILTFRQSPWMKPYIDFNNKKRKEALSTFDEEFFKLMNNSTFGKCMENVKRRVKMELTSDKRRCEYLIRKPTFQSAHIFNTDFVGVEYRKPQLLLDKPIYLGFVILDLSKLHMFDFHYNVMLKNFGLRSLQLIYTDTDSLIYKIIHDDFYKILKSLLQYFDFSNLDKSHFLFNNENLKVLGKFKDETGGVEIKEFVALRPKMYSMLFESGKVMKRVKGIKKSCVDKFLHSEFKDVLMNCLRSFATYNVIRSFKQKVYTVEEQKLALTPFEDKRWLCSNGIDSFAYGHYKISKRKRKLLCD